MAKKLTSSKAKEILHDKSVHGHPLTDKQRRFFGAIASGAPIKAESGSWLDKYAEGGEMVEEGPDPVRRPDPRYPQPTAADSLRVYNNAIAIRKYYDDLAKKGWYEKNPKIESLKGLNNQYFKDMMKDVKELSLVTYRRNLNDINSSNIPIEYHYFKNVYPNKSKQDYANAVAQSMKDTKSGTDRFYYYKDLYPSVIDPIAPSTLVDLNIPPNQQLTFFARRGDGLNSPPGGKYTGIYTYDPLSVKPWAMKTPQERIEWQKKYGKGIQTDKPQPKPQNKPKPGGWKPLKPFTGVIEQPKPEPTLPRIDFAPMEKIGATRSAIPSISSMPSLNIPQPQNVYRVEYENPEKPGTYIHQDFPSEKLGTRFQQSLQGNRTGYYIKHKDGGSVQENYNNASVSLPDGFIGMGYNTQGRNYSPAWGGQFQNGGISFLSLPQEDPEMVYTDRFNTPLNKKETEQFNKWVAKESERQGRDIMMDKGAYDIQGFWKSGDYKKMDKDNHGVDTWKKPNHPTFSNQSKYHGIDGFYGGNWTEEGGYQPSKQTASMYGPSYYDRMFAEEPGRIEHLDASRYRSGANKPSPLYYAMGGSLPGATGFMYARTAGAAPSNGPYAKKTLPSAQNGKKQGNPVFDWWYNLDDVQGTYKMYNDLDPFLKNWYQNPETQRRLKQNLQDSLVHRNTNPSQLTSQAINTLQNTPVFSRELVKKADVSSSDLEYNNELQGWKSPSTFGGNPYFDSHNYMTGTSELGSYDPDTKQIIVNSFNLPGTIAHEGVHGTPALQNAMEDVIDWKYLNRKNPKSRFSEQFGTLNWDEKGNQIREPFEKVKNRLPGIYSSWEKTQEYLDRDGMYPRIMDIRRTLNLKPGQKVDKSILENESISHPLGDLKHYYDEDTIIEMLNTLAKNDNKKTKASAENGTEMSYYQHGLDWKPKNISRNGSDVPKNQNGDRTPIKRMSLDEEMANLRAKQQRTSDAPSVNLAESEKRRLAEARQKADAKRTFISQGRQETPQEKAKNQRLREQYQLLHPNTEINPYTGELQTINPDRGFEGQPLTPGAKRFDKGLEHIMTGLEAAGYAEGLGALGKAGYNAAREAIGQSMESGLLSKFKPIEVPTPTSISSSVENTALPKITPEQWKDMSGFLRRRQFVKGLQQEGLVGKEFNLADVNYAARSTDKTNKLTQLALERNNTGFRNVSGKIPSTGIGRQSYTGREFNMNRPAHGQTISEVDNMINAGVDFTNPRSIAEYQATHIPLEDYGYRSTGEWETPDYGFLFRNPTPTTSLEYGNFQFKSKPNLNFESGNYEDWFNKYYKDLKYHQENPNVVGGPTRKENLTEIMPFGKTTSPSVRNATLVGPRGKKAFEIDESFPFINMEDLNSEQLKRLQEYIREYNKQYSTGWRGQYKKGGVIKDDRGQWAHPGEITEIGSNRITMKGVPYPVLGISDEGDQQMMYPEQEYKFKGKKVTEYPMKKANGGWLDKYN